MLELPWGSHGPSNACISAIVNKFLKKVPIMDGSEEKNIYILYICWNLELLINRGHIGETNYFLLVFLGFLAPFSSLGSAGALRLG